MSLGTDLAAARATRNITQRQLADYLHIKQAAVSMLESGELDVSPDLAARIREWISSGKGIARSAPRGPYKT